MPIANSSSSPSTRLERVRLDRLHPHPANANAMSEMQIAALARNIAREGQYPPLVARPHPEQPGHWQLLDGHQRCQALARLGHETAIVFPWPCDNATALILLATLNRLEGTDVPVRRAALLAELEALMPAAALAELLPEDAATIAASKTFLELDAERILADLDAAAARIAAAGPRTIAIILEATDVTVVEAAIDRAASALRGPNRRGRALAAICRRFMDREEPDD